MTEASLEGRARRRVGGHCAVEGVGAAGDGVDAHDVDLGALRGGRSVGVGGVGADWGNIGRSNPPPTDRRNKVFIFIFYFLLVADQVDPLLVDSVF